MVPRWCKTPPFARVFLYAYLLNTGLIKKSMHSDLLEISDFSGFSPASKGFSFEGEKCRKVIYIQVFEATFKKS